MEQTSTFKSNFLRKKLFVSLMILGLFVSQSLLAHDVTGYNYSCATGPKYTVDAIVANMNTGSNYSWQYKTGSGSWVCIINGNNTINGNNYSVSGATSTATTNPSPITFNNPNSALQGVVIRCVVSDGNGVNPCNMPSGNTYNSGTNSVNHTIVVNNTPCAPTNVLQLGNRVWYDVNNNGTNTNEDGIAGATVHLYKDDNNDNNADGAFIATDVTNADGYYNFANLTAGNYIVGVVTPNGYMSSSTNGGDPDNNINFDDNGQVTVANETRGLAITLAIGTEPDGNSNTTNNNITYDFGFLPDCNCTTNANNMLVNGSFENGTTGWSSVGGGVNFTTGTGYVACGTKNGFNDANGTGTAYVYQEFTANPGSIYTFKGFAGTHTAGLSCSPRLVMTFRRADGSNITEIVTPVTRDVDVNHNQLEQYTVVGTAPVGTVTMRVHGAINCNTLKMDAFCLTATNNLQLGSRVWYDTNNDGLDNNSEDGISGSTVRLYRDDNNDNVADGASIATDVTDINGYYSFTNLAAGNYIVGVVTPNGYMSSSISGGDPDNNINYDNNGQVAAGNETRGLAITLSAGDEPEGNINNTYDFGFLPDCNCTTSANNMLVNGSFENGTTGWSSVGGGVNFTTGTGYVACGTKNGFNDANGTGTAYVYQEFAANPGATYTFKGFAGTHTAGLNCNPRLVMTFRRADGSNITEIVTPVTRDVDANHNQLEQYTIVGTAPAGTVTMRVHGAIDCNTLKMDAFCLTTNCTTPATPVANVTHPTCAVATGSIVLSNLPSGSWTINGTNNGTPFTLTGSGTTFTQNNVNPGTYIYTLTVAGGCTSAQVTTVVNAQPATPTAPVAAISQFICGSNTTGTISLTGLPSTGTWTVTRTGPGTNATNGTITGTGTTASITSLAAGTYTFAVKNAAGCTSPVTTTVIGGPGRIGGTTWEDKNKNGRNDDGTNFLGGVVVKLYNADNNNVITGSVISTLTTPAGDGRYLFSNLCPGKYIVTFSDLNGYVRTLQLNQNVAELDNSDANQNTGYAPAINLAAGQLFGNIDAGYYTHTILPVTFGAITAQARNCEVNISFEVLTQKNTKQFEIEYSKDGANSWSNVGIVSAKNSSATAYKYSFTHTQPAIGVNLYRIKGVDADGKLTYSEVVSATSSCSGKGKINAYPNPAFEVLNVSLPSEYQDAQVQLFNGMGQLMVSDVRKSGLVRSLNTQNLTPGIYLLKVIHNNSVVMTQKVVKGE